MNIEVILVFIAIAIISSLSNRNKAKRQQQKRQPGQPPRNTQQQRESRSPSQQQQQRPQPQQRRKSLLEEMLEQYDLADPRKKQEPAQKKEPQKPKEEQETREPRRKMESTIQGRRKTWSSLERKAPEPKDGKKKDTGKTKQTGKKSYSKEIHGSEVTKDVIAAASVERGEIGQSEFNEFVDLDRRNLVRGIIMSEVLSKPVSMRKDRAV